jgi:hypothetical protein
MGLLSTRLVSRLTGLLVLSAALAGCNASRHNEQSVLSPAHGITNASVQSFSTSPSALRHQQHLTRSPQTHRHLQFQYPEAPQAVN